MINEHYGAEENNSEKEISKSFDKSNGCTLTTSAYKSIRLVVLYESYQQVSPTPSSEIMAQSVGKGCLYTTCILWIVSKHHPDNRFKRTGKSANWR